MSCDGTIEIPSLLVAGYKFEPLEVLKLLQKLSFPKLNPIIRNSNLIISRYENRTSNSFIIITKDHSISVVENLTSSC